MEEECIDLPDTQTQECVEYVSQETIKPWGRLSSLIPEILSVDLYDACYTVGRAKQLCNIVIDNPQLRYMQNISKAHFKINEENNIIYLLDLSKNGTFVNSAKVGRNKRNIIHNDDIIALGHPSAKAYVFNCNDDQKNLPSQIRKKYFISRLLGKGAVGEVRFALDKRTCQQYAIKRMFKSNSSSDLARLNHPQKIRTEIEILRKLSHPFIIEMKDVFETDKEVFLILEYMKGGILTNRIISVLSFDENEAKFIFYQMLLAVKYLHENGITHRDLKPENVLLATDDTYPMVKISDFGLSKVMGEVSKMETLCGTINYVAPEILNGKEKYSNKVDIWSLGVILFYMLCKELPFIAPERCSVVKNILNANISWNDPRWGKTSFTAKDIVKKMLVVNPEMRIGINELLKHPWIKQDVSMRIRVEQLCKTTSQLQGIGNSDLTPPPAKRLHRSA